MAVNVSAFERKVKKQGLMLTTVVHIIFIVLMLITSTKTLKPPPPPIDGVLVNLGFQM